MSALGFNLVRMHHLDADWLFPNIFGGPTAQDTQHLDSRVLESLDWWIKCLEDEGIYVWLDLEQDRRFRAADGIDGFAELSKGKNDAGLRGYAYVNPSIRRAMQRFNEAFVNHLNPFTGRRYKDDPGIVAMLISNENDVTHHFGNALLPNKHVPWYTARYMREAANFADTWGFPRDKTWRSWEPGPAKLFLNDLEHRFDVDMIANLRAQGVRIPLITTSQWGDNPLSSLPALTTGDLIDAHAYGGIGELRKNPLREPTMIDWLAAAQVAGMPLTVSEWNVEPFPVTDRHTLPLYVAAAASLQGWRAVMLYAYSQLSLDGPGAAGNWEAHNDPALMATMPAAALMYRRGDVREAQTTYAFAPNAEQFFHRSLSPESSVALRTVVEKGRLVVVLPRTPQLPWVVRDSIPAAATVVTDPQRSYLAPDADEATSDTGELRRNWLRGDYVIDTPRTQAAIGAIGGRAISLADVQIRLATENASVAVQSLDANPIGKSRHILVSIGARSMPAPGNKLPYRTERVMGSLALRAPKGLSVYAVEAPAEGSAMREDTNGQGPDGDKEITAPYKDGTYFIDLGLGGSARRLMLR